MMWLRKVLDGRVMQPIGLGLGLNLNVSRIWPGNPISCQMTDESGNNLTDESGNNLFDSGS